MSSTVKDLTAGSGLSFEDAGEHELEGGSRRLAPVPGGELTFDDTAVAGGSAIYSKSGNTLGNTSAERNVKVLVVGGLIRCSTSARVLLCCNVSGPYRDHFKHEDLGASPQMAKRLEDILRSKA